jgi:hypothetical protein
MNKADALEAAPIVQRCMMNLIKTVPSSGLTGSQARTAIGDTIAQAYPALRADTLGPLLDDSFSLARQSGATAQQLETVRLLTSGETPQTLGGTLIQNDLIMFCLVTEADIIQGLTFVSRQDVDNVLYMIKQPFLDAIDQAADDMDQMVFMGLVTLRGATVSYLVDLQRPLPRMMNYQFLDPQTTLQLAYRLYSDAGRADQVRDENKIIHPAFSPAFGQALSA